MQALAVVDGFDKGADGASGLAQIAIAVSVDLLLLQGFHEAFGLGVVVGIPDTAHAGPDVMHCQDFRVFSAGILTGLKWSSQHLEGGVAMAKRRRRSDRSGRAPLFSPGRPVVAGPDEQRQFWAIEWFKGAWSNEELWRLTPQQMGRTQNSCGLEGH
jgi:hypothetical protein